jgi:hypothetical protein
MVIFQIHVDTVDVAPILENIKFPKPTTPGKGPNRPASEEQSDERAPP